MYISLTRAERTTLRRENGKSQFFNVIYKALYSFDRKSLTPEDVWAEARRIVAQIKEVEECAREIEVLSFLAELPAFYGMKKEEDMMLVMSVVYFMFLYKHGNHEGHPYGKFCGEIKNRMSKMKGFAEFFGICLKEIDDAEKNGIPILNEYEMEAFLLECPEPCAETEKRNMDSVNLIVDEAIHSGVESMCSLETSMSRVNDKENNCYEQPLAKLRAAIDEALEQQKQPTTVHTDGGPFIAGGNFHQGAEIVTRKYLKS